SAATSRNTQYGVAGSVTAHTSSSTGASSTSAENTVQFRPPNLGTAKVYGSRNSEPTRFGIATSQNSCATEKWKPALFRRTATVLHSSHTENPRCSAKMENPRLRSSTRRPVRAQNPASSGFRSSIQRAIRHHLPSTDARQAALPPGHPDVAPLERRAHRPETSP